MHKVIESSRSGHNDMGVASDGGRTLNHLKQLKIDDM